MAYNPYNPRAWHILPASQYLFGKLKVTLADTMQVWDDVTVVVCLNETGHVRFISGTSGSYGEIGQRQAMQHDQTGANMGTWTVINEVSVKKVDGEVVITPRVPFDDKVNLKTKSSLAVFK